MSWMTPTRVGGEHHRGRKGYILDKKLFFDHGAECLTSIHTSIHTSTHTSIHRNFGVAKAATGKFKEAEEAFLSIQNERYR